MVALGGSRALVFADDEPVKVPIGVEQEVLDSPPGLPSAAAPAFDGAAAPGETLREAVRQLALENARLRTQLCPDVARLQKENEELRAVLLARCANYSMCAQAPPMAQKEWTGGDFVPAGEASFAWPLGEAPRRRRRGCRGGARTRMAGAKTALRDGSSEVSTEAGSRSRTTSEQLTSNSEPEILDSEDEGGDAVCPIAA